MEKKKKTTSSRSRRIELLYGIDNTSKFGNHQWNVKRSVKILEMQEREENMTDPMAHRIMKTSLATTATSIVNYSKHKNDQP